MAAVPYLETLYSLTSKAKMAAALVAEAATRGTAQGSCRSGPGKEGPTDPGGRRFKETYISCELMLRKTFIG